MRTSVMDSFEVFLRSLDRWSHCRDIRGERESHEGFSLDFRHRILSKCVQCFHGGGIASSGCGSWTLPMGYGLCGETCDEYSIMSDSQTRCSCFVDIKDRALLTFSHYGFDWSCNPLCYTFSFPPSRCVSLIRYWSRLHNLQGLDVARPPLLCLRRKGGKRAATTTEPKRVSVRRKMT